MRQTFMIAAVLSASVACKDKSDDTSSAPDVHYGDDTGDDSCEGHAPIVTVDSCTFPGLQEYEQYDDPVPTINFAVAATDEDGDMDEIALDIYMDGVADGIIDATDDSVDVVNGTPGAVSDGEPCATTGVNISQTLALPAGSVTYGEAYDWGFTVTDHAGYTSEIAVITCFAPNEDGTELTE